MSDVTGQISDGYHTFDELYRYQMIYHAWAVRAWQQTVIQAMRTTIAKEAAHQEGPKF